MIMANPRNVKEHGTRFSKVLDTITYTKSTVVLNSLVLLNPLHKYINQTGGGQAENPS